MKRLLILIFFVSSKIYSYSPGTKAGEFLKIDPSGFSRALGGNEINFMDASCFSINPSLSSFILKSEFSVSQLNWFETSKFYNFSYFIPVNFLTLGLTYNLFKIDEIEGYDFNAQHQGTYSSNNEILIFSLATRKRNLGFGINFKKIKEDLIEVQGKGTLFDFSLSFVKKLFKFSIVMRNMGKGIEYEGKTERVSNGLILGGNFNFKKFEFYSSYNIFSEEKNWYKFGLRYGLTDSIFILSGFNTRGDILRSFSFGIEFQVSRFKLLYSYQKSSVFNDINSFNLTYKFGPTRVKDRIYRRAKKLFEIGRIREAKEEIDKLLIIAPEWKKAKRLNEKIIKILKISGQEEVQ